MKILFVSPEYPHPRPSGGIASYVRDISQELSCRGHDVKILSAEDHLSSGARYSILQDGGVEVHFIGRSYCGWLSKFLGHPFFRYGLPWLVPDMAALLSPVNVFLYYKKLIKKWKPDVIESFDWQAHGFFIHLLERRVPTVFRGEGHAKVIVGNNGKAWTKRLESQHRLERWAARKSSFVVPCSKLLGHDEMIHFEIPAERIQPIPNCFSPDMLKGERPGGNEENHEIRVCFVGRIEHRKGIDLLLEAGHRLHARFPEMRYFFIGKDHLGVRDYLAKASFSTDFLGKLHFIGQISRHEVQQYLLKSDFAVFPSRYEPFGIVALESMACGLPVIVSSAGGWSEAVEDGVTGFLVEPGDVESLRQAMEKIILLGPEKRQQMGHRARRIMQEHFSAAEIAGKMETFYRDAVKERSQRKSIH
jgi:glycosyltransferase involved in cell wall biosynthesis